MIKKNLRGTHMALMSPALDLKELPGSTEDFGVVFIRCVYFVC